jgi:mono/diheme cytochrome c family protein
VVERIAILPLICAALSIGVKAQEDVGKAAFARVCQVCHGSEGRGDAGPSLVPLDKALDEVLAIVREGVGQMPPISAERVSDEDVTRIVAYLKSLKSAQPDAKDRKNQPSHSTACC